MFTISREIQNAKSFYGLSSAETDSHMIKNSEWGAVAYLAHSRYGRSGTEVTVNNYNNENAAGGYRYGITGLAGSAVSAATVKAINSVYAYNTQNGVLASTTGNVTGVFDWFAKTATIVSCYGGIDKSVGMDYIGKDLFYETYSSGTFNKYIEKLSGFGSRKNMGAYKLSEAREVASATRSFGGAVLEIGGQQRRGEST